MLIQFKRGLTPLWQPLWVEKWTARVKRDYYTTWQGCKALLHTHEALNKLGPLENRLIHLVLIEFGKTILDKYKQILVVFIVGLKI